MATYVIASNPFKNLKTIEKLINQWRKDKTLKTNTSVYEVKQVIIPYKNIK
jgi:hypothetical protein